MRPINNIPQAQTNRAIPNIIPVINPKIAQPITAPIANVNQLRPLGPVGPIGGNIVARPPIGGLVTVGPRPVVAPVAFPVAVPTNVRPIASPNIQQTRNTPTMPIQAIKPITRTVEPSVPAPITGGGIMNTLARGRTAIAPTAIAVQTVSTAAPNFVLVQETEETLLRNLSSVLQVTQPQLQMLLSAQYQDGTNIISLKRRDIIMEIIGMINRDGFDSTIEFLQNAANPEYILWNQPAMDESRTNLAREINVQQLEEVGIKGIGKCNFCNSKELVFSMKQTRGGDEPMTVFVRCVLCDKQWKQG